MQSCWPRLLFRKSTVLDGRADGRCPCAPHQQLSVPEQLAGLHFCRLRRKHGNDTGVTNHILNITGVNCEMAGGDPKSGDETPHGATAPMLMMMMMMKMMTILMMMMMTMMMMVMMVVVMMVMTVMMVIMMMIKMMVIKVVMVIMVMSILMLMLMILVLVKMLMVIMTMMMMTMMMMR